MKRNQLKEGEKAGKEENEKDIKKACEKMNMSV